ncbi:hypothetical protein BX616_003046, partial [Lobosporangium transversale]
MSLTDEVAMATDSGNDSETGNVSSPSTSANGSASGSGGHGSNSHGFRSSSANALLFPTLTASGRLAKLLAREKELIAMLDQINIDIEQLEASLDIDEGKAHSNNASGTGCLIGTGTSSGNASNGAGVADEDLEEEVDDLEEFEAPEWCVPIKANVMTYDWDSLAAECQFDVILMDPPWQLATHAPTRGVAIAYQQLPDICIEELPVPKLSSNGFIFIWVINNKYAKAFDLMRRWGYSYVDDITW